MPDADGRHLFIVRIWMEQRSGTSPGAPAESRRTWRGLVEHAITGHKMYFDSLSDLNDFIVLSLGLPPLQHKPDPET